MSSRRTRFGWAFFDWAQQPYYTLIGSFVFRPYFVAVVAATPAIGQAQIGLTGAAAGLIVAIAAPLVGVALDRASRRAWMAWTSLPFMLACAALWWTPPDGRASIPFVLACLTTAAVLAEITTMVNNAMMPAIAGVGRVGRLSGYGVALGALGGIVSSLIVIAAFLSPATPLLGLDKATHEPERFVGPFTAIWYGLFIIPLFLTYPAHAKAAPRARPVREFAAFIRQLRQNSPMLRFLVGRMLVADGAAAVQIFGGIIAATLFHWSASQLALFGIMVLAFAGLGSMLGGHLDDRTSAKRSVLISCTLLTVALAGMGSVTASHVLFFIPVQPMEPGGSFLGSPSEQVFFAFTMLLATMSGPLVGSMRTWMARLSPPGEEGRWFGLYAVAGRATAFAAPLAVSLATLATNDTRAAIPVMLVFLVAGIVALRTVPAASS